jgi:hypothetical protein
MSLRITFENGTMMIRNSKGELHCEDRPAMIHADGTKQWFINNKQHRLSGPAFEWANGKNGFYLDDKQMSEEEFLKDPRVIEFNKKTNTTTIYESNSN